MDNYYKPPIITDNTNWAKYTGEWGVMPPSQPSPMTEALKRMLAQMRREQELLAALQLACLRALALK